MCWFHCDVVGTANSQLDFIFESWLLDGVGIRCGPVYVGFLHVSWFQSWLYSCLSPNDHRDQE